MNYFYKAHLETTTSLSQNEIKSVKAIQKIEDFQTDVKTFLKIKYNNNNYSVCSLENKSLGQIQNLPDGVKPIAMNS